MSYHDINEILRRLSEAWDYMLIPKFKKKKWKNLKKHIEQTSSLLEWKRVLSDFYIPLAHHYKKNPLTEMECEAIIQEGIKLFHEGKASQVLFLSMFYEKAGGPILHEFNLPNTNDEIRCRASFITAVVSTVLIPSEEFQYCYEAIATLTGSDFHLGQGFFNMKQNSLVFITNKRILVFGSFPDFPPKKVIDKKLGYALYRQYHENMESKKYLIGLDVIDRETIFDIIEANKNRARIWFKSEYYQVNSNVPVPGFMLLGLVSVVIREVDKRKHHRKGNLTYFFTLSPSTKENVLEFLDRVRKIG